MFLDLVFAVLLFALFSRNVTTANSKGRLYFNSDYIISSDLNWSKAPAGYLGLILIFYLGQIIFYRMGSRVDAKRELFSRQLRTESEVQFIHTLEIYADIGLVHNWKLGTFLLSLLNWLWNQIHYFLKDPKGPFKLCVTLEGGVEVRKESRELFLTLILMLLVVKSKPMHLVEIFGIS